MHNNGAISATQSNAHDGVLELVNVKKSYDDFVAVADFQHTVAAGSYVCLLGPSGCGKSTTLRMIAGHESISSGSILLGGKDIGHLAPAKRSTAMMFQNYALFPHLTVIDNVAFSLKMKGIDKATRHKKAVETLELVQMTDFIHRLPDQLSGGQQQRVALARALVTEPSILLLDEPLSALDPFLRIRMRTELSKLQRELGITFIHVTHSQDEALALADDIVLMNKAVIEQTGSPHTIYNKPRTEFVAKFIGGHNVVSIDGRKHALRTDKVKLCDPGAQWDGVVSNVEFLGRNVNISLISAEGAECMASISDHEFQERPWKVGEAAGLSWESNNLHLLEEQ